MPTYTPILRLVFLLLSSILLSWQLFAQTQSATFLPINPLQYNFANKEVKQILQDRDGFIWMATTKGLCRYDGHEIRVYRENPLDQSSLGDSSIEAMAEDGAGHIWIGTQQAGVFKYDRYRDIFSHVPLQPFQNSAAMVNRVSDLLIDRRGNLWIATYAGLYQIDARSGQDIKYPYVPSGSMDIRGWVTSDLAEDQLGNIWVGTGGGGLVCLNPQTGVQVSFSLTAAGARRIPSNHIIQILSDERGYVWVATEEGRLLRISVDSYEVKHFAFTNEKTGGRAKVRIMVLDETGNLWLGTRNSGMIYFAPNTGKRQHYRHDPLNPLTIPSDHIDALSLDQSGNLWVSCMGSQLGQLVQVNPGFVDLPIRFETATETFIPQYKCVLEDRQGNLWIGTWGNGLIRYHPTTVATASWQHHPDNAQSLANNMVWDLLEDETGLIWIATHKGLQKFDPINQTFTTYGREAGLEHESIRSLWQDQQGRIWLGTFGGLHWLDTTTDSIHFEDFQSVDAHFIVWDLLKDSQQQLWVGAYNKGVYRIDLKTGKWVFFAHDNDDLTSLSNNRVLRMAEDGKKRIWLATKGGGLNLFLPESGTFQHWRPYNSDIPDEIIHDLSIDTQNQLWLSTDLGLYTFDPQTQLVKAHHLAGTSMGCNVETRPGIRPVIYAGNSKHLYQIFPDSIVPSDRTPPIYLTDLQIKGKSVPVRNTFGDSLKHPSPLLQAIPYTSAINLKHWQNDLTFTFAALQYLQPENNQYRYILENEDEEWTAVDANRRFVRYNNLAPGHYVFRVALINAQGEQAGAERSIAIRIYSPWWLRWWAYLLYGFLFFGGLWLIRRYEINRQYAQSEARRLRELDEVKTHLYTNITHEFRTPLTIVLGIADQLKNQVSVHAQESLQLIKRNGQQLLQLVNQMLDLAKLESGHLKLNLQQGDVVNYLRYLLDSFHSYAESKDIRLHFFSERKELHMVYDPVRLMHIVSNLLTNAIKFTPAGKDVYLTVDVIVGKQLLQIKVKDTGIGIPPEKIPYIFDRFYQVVPQTDVLSTNLRPEGGTGIGLTLTRELVKLMGGTIEVKSELGDGSTFIIQLPITTGSTESAPAVTHVATTNVLVPEQVAVAANVDLPDKPLLLIVEDNPDLVKYLVNCFNPAYNLTVAYNGQQGIDKAISEIPDLIITDVMMPEKDGFELCAVLKQHEMTSHIPIIMLTARVDLDARLVGLRRGADAYLDKPFVREELEVQIRALLKQRQDLQTYYRAKFSITEVPPTGMLLPAEAEQEQLFLTKVNQIINDNLSNQQFSVEQLSKDLYFSSSSLYRKLKALTGQNPNQYIRSLRLAKAQQMLRQSNASITTIALETGFTDQNYFSRIFKREIGQTPTAYRAGGSSHK